MVSWNYYTFHFLLVTWACATVLFGFNLTPPQFNVAIPHVNFIYIACDIKFMAN